VTIKKTISLFVASVLCFVAVSITPSQIIPHLHASGKDPLTLENVLGITSKAGIFRMASQDGSNFYPLYTQGMASDSKGNIYISDNGEAQIEVFSSTLKPIRNIGSIGNKEGQFQYLTGLSIDSKDHVYGVDTYLGRIQEFDPNGKFIKTIGEKGSNQNQLLSPTALAFNKANELIVTDLENGVKVFSSEGKFLRDFSSDEKLIPGTDHDGPIAIAVDQKDFVYILMASPASASSEILCFNGEGVFQGTTVSSGIEENQLAGLASSFSIHGKNLYISMVNMQSGSKIKKMELSDSPKESAKFVDIMADYPNRGIAENNVIVPSGTLYSQDHLYFLDGLLNRLVMMDDSKSVVNMVQSPAFLYGFLYGDQSKPKGFMSNPQGVRLDKDGFLYVADSNYGDVVVFDPQGEEFARMNLPDQGNRPANPADVAIDENGFIYISDMPNNTIHVFDEDFTYWMSIEEDFNFPQGLCINHDGDLLVANSGNSSISKIDIMDVVDEEAYSIDTYFVPGQWPVGISVDSNNNMVVGVTGSDEVHILDQDGSLIKKVGSTGSKPGELGSPQGVWVDAEDNFYVAETTNGRIQKFDMEGELLWSSELQWAGLTFIAQGPDGKLYVSDCMHNSILVINDETAVPPGDQAPSISESIFSIMLPDDKPLIEDSPFTLQLYAEKLTSVQSILFSLELSSENLSFIEAIKGELLENSNFEISQVLTDFPYLVFSVSKKSNVLLSGDGILLNLSFKAKKAGNYTVSFDSITLSDRFNKPLQAKELNGLDFKVMEKDTTPPELEIGVVPGVVYTEELTIRGLTEAQALVTINDELVSLNDNGTFIHTIKLKKGENLIVVIAKDLAGNETRQEFTVSFKDPVVIKLQIGNTTILINSKEARLDAAPFIDKVSGRTLVPIRAIVEAIDGKIGWEATEQKVTIEKDALMIELWIGKPMAKIDGKEVKIDPDKPVTPLIVKGRTFLPLRFVAENLGFKVEWDGATQTITLTYPDLSKED
jgi:DNA-binding beta-propeller fold protein YncE